MKEKAKDPDQVLEPERQTVKRDALAVAGQQLPTEININQAREKFIQIQAFQKLVQTQLHENLDYGVIPGTKKPTLYKAGAEKIVKLLDLADTFEIIEKVEDWEKGFFFYNFRVRLVSLIGGQVVSEGVGSCNSKEEKYRWRWVSADKVPKGIDPKDLESKGCKRTLFEFEFAINKGETTGHYGKPAEYWERWRKAIQEKRAKPKEKETRDKKKMLKGYEIIVDETLYRLPNDDIFSIVNTIEKMGKKRAMVDAALSVGRLSELFTQDLEDTSDHDAGDVGQDTGAEGNGAAQEKPKAEPKAKSSPPARAQAAAAKPKPKEEAGAFVPDEDEPPDSAYEGDEGAQPEDKEFPDTVKKTDAKGELVKNLQEHLKIAFGKAYPTLYKRFKDWCGNAAGPKLGHNFVGLDHGNWSLNAGDESALLFLYENRARAVESFHNFLAKAAAAAAAEKGE